MAERALRMRLGLFAGGTLAALAGLVVLFGGAPQVFSSATKYSILFPEAPGIVAGTPIRKSGVRVGQVTAIELDPASGLVRVRVNIDPKYPPRRSEEANITRGLLSGDSAIDFLPKLDETGQPVPRGDEWPAGSDIPGIPPITPRTVINQDTIAKFQQSIDRITKVFEKLEKLEKLGPKLETAVDEAGGLFKDIRGFVPELRSTNRRIQNLLGPDPAAPPLPKKDGPVVPISHTVFAQPPMPPAAEPNLKELIRDAQEALRAIKPVADDIRGTFKRLEPEITAAVKGARTVIDNVNDVLSPENRKQFSELIKNINSVATTVVKFAAALGTVLDQAEKTLKNLDTQVGLVIGDVRAVTRPLAARAENLVKSVNDSADELNRLLTEVRGVVGTFAKENGSLQKLITDPTVYRNIDDATASLARILARSEKITRDLEVFADKVARRPELIGVGGALRPSAGLKEVPGVPSYRPEWPPATSARPPQGGPAWLDPLGPPPAVQGYKP
jgi:phospholipid/cholesterol/gamma-HCH transport system substrate-binding protein